MAHTYNTNTVAIVVYIDITKTEDTVAPIDNTNTVAAVAHI